MSQQSNEVLVLAPTLRIFNAWVSRHHINPRAAIFVDSVTKFVGKNCDIVIITGDAKSTFDWGPVEYALRKYAATHVERNPRYLKFEDDPRKP